MAYFTEQLAVLGLLPHNLPIKTGATIYATAAGEDIEFVKSLGANKVIDYTTQDFIQEFDEVDLVIVLGGGKYRV